MEKYARWKGLPIWASLDKTVAESKLLKTIRLVIFKDGKDGFVK